MRHKLRGRTYIEAVAYQVLRDGFKCFERCQHVFQVVVYIYPSNTIVNLQRCASEVVLFHTSQIYFALMAHERHHIAWLGVPLGGCH